MFCHFQTYNEYNRGLDDLLATAKLDSYPILCSSMTEAFNKLSESAIRIKVKKKRKKKLFVFVVDFNLH